MYNNVHRIQENMNTDKSKGFVADATSALLCYIHAQNKFII